jgi:hypothetical protein
VSDIGRASVYLVLEAVIDGRSWRSTNQSGKILAPAKRLPGTGVPCRRVCWQRAHPCRSRSVAILAIATTFTILAATVLPAGRFAATKLPTGMFTAFKFPTVFTATKLPTGMLTAFKFPTVLTAIKLPTEVFSAFTTILGTVFTTTILALWATIALIACITTIAASGYAQR